MYICIHMYIHIYIYIYIIYILKTTCSLREHSVSLGTLDLAAAWACCLLFLWSKVPVESISKALMSPQGAPRRSRKSLIRGVL